MAYMHIISKYNGIYIDLFRIMNIKGINRCVVYFLSYLPAKKGDN